MKESRILPKESASTSGFPVCSLTNSTHRRQGMVVKGKPGDEDVESNTSIWGMIGFIALQCLIASGVRCTLKKLSCASQDQAATLQTSPLKPDLLNYFFFLMPQSNWEAACGNVSSALSWITQGVLLALGCSSIPKAPPSAGSGFGCLWQSSAVRMEVMPSLHRIRIYKSC